MSSGEVVSKPQQRQQISRHEPQDYQIEAREQSASASASAGLNLNIFGAISGIFGSKSRKDTAADGSSIEHREERAAVKGAGMANMSAYGAGQAQARDAQFKHIPIGDDGARIEDAPPKKKIEGRK